MRNKKDRKTHLSHHGDEVGGAAHQRNTLAVKAEAAISDQLLPGRHPCNCQARIHALVRNCMGCGKIVCVQEGSGPCFFCGTLVCTKEEREILDRGSRKSAELYNQLMGAKKGGRTKDFSLSAIGAEFEKATQFRNKLLAADADSERRTKINDLESDYSSIENNPYLTAEERRAIMQRRMELQQIREKRRKNILINVNFGNMSISEGKQDLGASATYDPIIDSIIDKLEERRQAADAARNPFVDAEWVLKGFIPKYDQSCGSRFESNTKEFSDVDALCMMNEELAKLEVERRGYAFAIPQPYASLVSNGVVRYIRWSEDVNLKGPVFICSTVSSITNNDVSEFLSKMGSLFVNNGISGQIDFSHASILGRAFLDDCITYKEFSEKHNAPVFGEGNFVLVFSSFEPLTVTVPYVAPSPFFRLEKEILHVLGNVFSS
ncbi:hypothetical protein NECAME_10281 [Necator americanus]|uniref:Uncharacterized protein n=1 Tax=Necator americanus TaxID=51031 RepID=W2TC17_NECAM|nr:hypothetical protein NECAME_10281 [Necator americanus]ETN78547.1 hypothetical protein NECAME_10281 [Necator americanus]